MSRPILATGGTGQLATALARARPNEVGVVGRPDFDFDRPQTIPLVLRALAPALVINAAAWTAVDAAENAADAADRANNLGAAMLARHCRSMGIALIHISTDYVFDGLKGAPYTEDDPTGPTGVYGSTKRAGELAVREAHPDSLVLRTSWVYATTGKNFLLTMLGAARRVPVLRVVADQRGCPTNADDLAEAVLAVADRLRSGLPHPAGIYHATGQGETTWHGFAAAILAEAALHGWPHPLLQAIATTDWPTPARRPPDSRLDCTRLAETFGVRLPPWEPSLRNAIASICGVRPPALAGAG